MKILMIATKDYNFYNFRSNLILKLMNAGHKVCLVCPYGNKIDYFTSKGCTFRDLKIDRRGTNIFHELSLLKDCKKIIKTENPDLVLTYTTKCSIYPGIACRHLKKKYIVNNAGLVKANGPLSFVLNCLYKYAFKKASCMMYQNTAERDFLNRLLKNKVHYRDLPGSGVDLNVFTFKEYPSVDSPIVFNYVGRIVELKGIKEFLDCAEFIKEKYANTKFVIYGEYDDMCYKNRIEDLIKKNVVEYGGVLLDMKPAIIEANAVIHASHYEGMTNVVLEHSAMGRVCIGSNIPGIKEGIDDGITGFLFEAENVHSLNEAVEKFINLPYEEKKKMGKKAREKMEETFNRKFVEDIYFEEIQKIEDLQKR